MHISTWRIFSTKVRSKTEKAIKRFYIKFMSRFLEVKVIIIIYPDRTAVVLKKKKATD